MTGNASLTVNSDVLQEGDVLYIFNGSSTERNFTAVNGDINNSGNVFQLPVNKLTVFN